MLDQPQILRACVLQGPRLPVHGYAPRAAKNPKPHWIFRNDTHVALSVRGFLDQHPSPTLVAGMISSWRSLAVRIQSEVFVS